MNHFVVDVAGSVSSSQVKGRPRPLFVLLSLFLGLALAACGGGSGGGDDGDDGTVDDSSDGVDDSTDDTTDDGTDDGADDGTPDSGPDFEQVPLIEGLTTLAGAGIIGNFDGDRDTALFNNPVNLVMTDDGNMIVADFDNGLVRVLNPAGDVTTISQQPEGMTFVRPFGLAIAGTDLYVQTDGNSLGQPGPPGGALWRMPLAGGAPVLVRDNIGRCRGVALLSDGRLVLTDHQAHVIQLFDPTSGALTPLAGTRDTAGFADGVGAAAQFNQPYDVIVLDEDSVLLADFGNQRLRQVDLDGTVITFAGTGASGRDDGTLDTATFHSPQGLARDSLGTMYVTDTGSHLVRRIAGEQVTTIAGDGTAGWKDDADPLAGQLFAIEGLDVAEETGYLYIADGTRGDEAPYHRIRRLTLPAE